MLQQTLAAAVLLLALLPAAAPLSLPDPLGPPDPAQAGRWWAPFDGEVPAVSMVVLPTGEVLYWSGADARHILTSGAITEAPGKALARVADFSGSAPRIRVPTPEDGGAGDIFCAGQAPLGDGRVLIAGGTRYALLQDTGNLHLYGLDQALGFDPSTRAFAEVDDMAFWRWYPTVLPLHDGGAMAIGGTADLFQGGNVRTSERYDLAADAWTSLPASADKLLPLYPHVLELPSGPLAGHIAYVPGGCTSCTGDDIPEWNLVQTLDPATGAWTRHASAPQPALDYSASVLLALRPPEYRPEVLTLGGGHDALLGLDAPDALPLAQRADFGAVPPTVQAASPMASPRWYPNAVLLPTGEVLAVGGALTGHKVSRFNPPVLAAEVYDPEATGPGGLPGAWTTLASMEVPRGYHSTAILLPDGRVLAGGHVPLGALAPAVVGAYEARLEVFEPPYLFRGARPAITDAPAELRLGAGFDVATPDAASVTRAVLMRPGATTHTVDSAQRLVELAISARTAAGLTLDLPADDLLVPPGAWMLFLLQDHGQGEVPSAARFVRVLR